MNKESIQHDQNGKNKYLSRIEVNFGSNVKKHQWSVFGHPINMDEEQQQIRIVKKRSDDSVFYLFSIDENIDFVDLISHAITIVNVNSEMEKKMILMQEKINELGELFQNLTYNELTTLKFVYKAPKNKKQKSPIKNTQTNNIDVHPENVVEEQFEYISQPNGKFRVDETPDNVIPEDL